MECDVCSRPSTDKLNFNCPTCARNALYPLRIHHATTLIDRERLAPKVEAVILNGSQAPRENISLSGMIIDTSECGKSHELRRLHTETVELNARLEDMKEKVEALRREMEAHRKTIATKKSEVAQRKSDADSANFGLDDRSAKEVETVQSSIRRRLRRWDLVHQETVTDRSTLCRAAAQLAGLKRVKVVENDRVLARYNIALKWQIFDLREVHNASFEELNASLAQVAALTHRVSTYLGLRLPAEIIVSHRDCPLPTILSPDSSYLNRDLAFPSVVPGRSSGNSPASSRTLNPQPAVTARPLFLLEPLPDLLKDAPATFGMFVEGITLLAWDIAWLCKTQGMEGFTSWKDICSIGSNLWYLLAADPIPDTLRSDSESQDARERRSANRTPTAFGQYSHGTAHSFLGAEGTELMNAWKLRPAELMQSCILRVKKHIIGAIKGPEWEVIDEKEWDNGEGDNAADEPVLVGGRHYRPQDGGLSRRTSSSGLPTTPNTLRRLSANFPSPIQNLQRQALESAAAASTSRPGLTSHSRRTSIGSARGSSEGAGLVGKNGLSSNTWTKIRSRNSISGASNASGQ